MEQEIGIVDHFFGHIGVAAIKITGGTLKPGDTIHVKGHTTDFTEVVKTIQVNHKDVPEAKAGDDVGVKMEGKCRQHDKVFKITPD